MKSNFPISTFCVRVAVTLLCLTAIDLFGAENPAVRSFQSLDGTWEIVFDSKNEGRHGGWQKEPVFSAQGNRRKIQVPSCWEEIAQDYEGVAFYGTHFKVSPEWKGRVVRLQFDAVNYVAEVWLNGVSLGRHEGGYGPFEFRVDDLLTFGQDNFLSLRVLGPIVAEDKVIDGIGWNDMPHWRGALAAGIWQSVRLVATGTVVVRDGFIIPRLADGAVAVRLALDNVATRGREVTAEVLIGPSAEPGAVVARKPAALSLRPGRNEGEWTLPIPQARTWSPDDPYLYTARISISDRGESLDAETVRFGMRELTIRDQRFELNGKPIYIRAAFFEGLYPTRLASPDSEAMARREITLAKEAGFNLIRPWRKPPPPGWLDLCDELGVMVMGGIPIECMNRWPTVTPQLPERIENEVRSAILRDRNRACIVQWEIFNEIWRKELERLKHPMSMLARQLDPSRLILDESGGYAGGANIYLPHRYEPEVFNDIHRYPGAPLSDPAYDQFLTLARTPEEIVAMGRNPKDQRNRHATPGRLTFVSEIGYGSLPDLVDNNARFARDGNPLVPPYRYHRDLAESFRTVLQRSGLDAIYPDLQRFCLDQQTIHSQANRRMIEAIRSNPRTGGYAVHALTDGDLVLGAGLLDIFRNPKESYWGTKAASQPRCLALRVQPRNVYAARGTRLELTGINDGEPVAATLFLAVVDAAGHVVLERRTAVDLPGGISRLLDEPLDTRALTGAHEVRVKLVDAGGVLLAENTVSFDVFSAAQLAPPSGEIVVLDPAGTLRGFLKAQGIAFAEFDAATPPTVPVLVGGLRDAAPNVRARFASLEKFVRGGGTAVFLAAVQRTALNSKLPDQDILPVPATLAKAMGLWVGVAHVVTDHPVFAGLPSKSMMGQPYENVYSPQSLVGTGGELIVASVSHGFHSENPDKQNYLGPDGSWFGLDMGVVRHGQGRYVLSALRIVENLGKDPVADKILFNLMTWVEQGRP